MMSFKEYVQYREAAPNMMPNQGQDDDAQVTKLVQASGVNPAQLANVKKLQMKVPGTDIKTAAKAADVVKALGKSKKSKNG